MEDTITDLLCVGIFFYFIELSSGGHTDTPPGSPLHVRRAELQDDQLGAEGPAGDRHNGVTCNIQEGKLTVGMSVDTTETSCLAR